MLLSIDQILKSTVCYKTFLMQEIWDEQDVHLMYGIRLLMLNAAASFSILHCNIELRTALRSLSWWIHLLSSLVSDGALYTETQQYTTAS